MGEFHVCGFVILAGSAGIQDNMDVKRYGFSLSRE